MTACVTYERRVEKPRAASSVGVGRRASSNARATYGSRLRILRWHADVVSSSSFRVSLWIFEQKRDCSQSSFEAVEGRAFSRFFQYTCHSVSGEAMDILEIIREFHFVIMNR